MKFVKGDELKLGMRLAKPIYNKDGVMLYERNSKLTRQGIVSIQNFGLIGVYILEPAEPLPPMTQEDIEFERFQSMAVFSIREILDAVTKQKEAKGMYQFANQILRRYGSLNHKINFVQNLRSNDDYVYKHSLNTAILAALISHRMELEFKQQLDIVVASILHDIGNLLIPPHIRRKRKNEMTEEDEKKIRTYHYAASQLIDNDYDLDPDVKRIVKGFIAGQHQTAGENATVKKSIGIEILKVAYAYDTMTAMKYEEEPASEIAALRNLLAKENGYDQNVVNGLVASINILQAGVCVELTNGDRGLVVAANDADVLSPIILSFRDNVLYNMADRYISSEIQIKDIMKTMDNRHVMNNDMLSQYEGSAVHVGEKRSTKNY
jgi:5'-deoxynucleotidase YfbR-like HD superfamily hydrolase